MMMIIIIILHTYNTYTQKGLIRITDPPFRKGGDLMACPLQIDRRLLDYVGTKRTLMMISFLS